MITCQNNLFHLKNSCFSYLMQVDAYGQLQHIHFGQPVQDVDAQALSCRPGLGWGSSVRLEDSDSHSCPDDKMLEWSGSGRGDYREPPLDIGVATELRYVNHIIHNSIVPMESSMPQARGDCQTLEIILEQKNLRLRLYYSLFDTALTRRAVLENLGDESISLRKLMSFSLDVPGEFQMLSFHGGWAAEMRPSRVAVGGARVVNESNTGFSSHRSNPGFLLCAPDANEDYGLVYGFNLIYSGNHYASAQLSQQNLTRVMQGINPENFSLELIPGGSFETPEAVMTVSENGFAQLSHRMHKFVNQHIVPAYWRNRPRPVLYNIWEGCGFDFNQHRLVKLAKDAQDLGFELFVVDDGWFGKRNNDLAGLGDYTVNKKKLPKGIPGLAKKIHGRGMQFGLWFEPESVNMDSDLYRAHPDWALTDEFSPLLSRHQLLLDLTRQEVRDYIVEQVGAILDTGVIDYVKWDMNRHSIALGHRAHRYILGLYEVMHRLFDSRPQILLEGCASGGNRYDLGMLCFGPQFWISDCTDPIERLTIQGSASYLYPLSTMGSHVSASPNAQTLRNTPLYTRGNVAYFGCLGYELDLKHLLPVDMKQIKAQTAFYKQYREVFQYGTFRRSSNGWQVRLGKTTIAAVFHPFTHTAPGYERLQVPGLPKDKLFTVRSQEQVIRIGQFGELLRHVAPVKINPNGALLRMVDARFTLKDGFEELTASGGALESGIFIQPYYCGQGYSQEQRTQSDYGSCIYVITQQD